MSSLPPNLAGSILQGHLTQRQVSAAQNREKNQRANADRQQTAAIDEQDSTVETTDEDTQVHTDAEGGGSQGRSFTEPQEEADQAENQNPPDGDSGHHIDLEA